MCVPAWHITILVASANLVPTAQVDLLLPCPVLVDIIVTTMSLLLQKVGGRPKF
jgi:hypothetical protein